MGGGIAYQGLVGAGGMGKEQWCRSKGPGAGGIIADVIVSTVNNGASIGGACWGAEARGG